MNSADFLTEMIIFALSSQSPILDRPSYGSWTMLDLKTGEIISCQVCARQICSLHRDNLGILNINND